MSDKADLRLSDLGEQGLLQRLQSFCPPEFVGDDAALLTVPPGRSLVVTTDVLVDGVHFSDRTTSAIDVGWRAAAANLSDLAAMGATPLGITVGLSLPKDCAIGWIEELYQGLVACLQPYATPIIGGDICRSNVITVSITALGHVDPAQVIRRSDAQPGDAILVTGVHGASRAGLELLLHPEQGEGLSSGERATLTQAHQRPIPRLDVIPLLHAAFENTVPFRVGGMDSSDGLADAVLQICRASGVGAQLERNQIPVPTEVQSCLTAEQAIAWALYGGEDFELVLCLPEAIAQALQAKLGSSAAIIGTITQNPQVVLHDSSGLYSDEVLSLDRGFQHFSS
ncbi:thiamine-phosphate kinase [Oscillatoria sp. FACHB-1407]|uniref:thiamine-phosphate kinase n=1 Tax=Oscillatoria sp. FACHB-1407 TaxID=2692847 RepID=UPI0016881C1E|nr:thiamine-phosphate kinase [Oscillatoria sp. FACHB-1407]MBD2460703.1 thiamine-phosphate kinase [Oscillatoria sp. FACHB-1407]